MTPASRLYVYYRVAETGLEATSVEVHAMQAALTLAHPGLRAGLLRRPESRDGMVTLMETYEGADPAIWSAALLRASAGLPQPRHEEWFEPLP
jgi:Domain of unknown function (DUF4936)